MRRRRSTRVLDYAPTEQPHWPEWLLRLRRPFRICAFVVLLGWGYFIAVTVRGWDAGAALPALLIVTTLYVAPLAVAAFLGMPWRRQLALVALLTVIPALAGEAQCTLEERMFLREVQDQPPTADVVFKPRRWWPNGSSYLYYDPATGRLGGGD